MKLPRRAFLHLTAGAAALPAVSRIAWAQSYPVRPVRLIVQVPAGSAPDIIARVMGDWLSERLGQQFVIDNRPGASGNIATEAVIRAPADGYYAASRHVGKCHQRIALRESSFQFCARRGPGGKHRQNSLGLGDQSVASTEDDSGVHRLCQGQSGQDQRCVDRKRNAASRRGGAVQDDGRRQPDSRRLPRRADRRCRSDRWTGTGHVRGSAVDAALHQVWPVARAGRDHHKPPGGAAGRAGASSEFLPGFEASGWYGIAAPKDTSPEIVERLNKEVNAALTDPKTKQRLTDLGCLIVGGVAR